MYRCRDYSGCRPESNRAGSKNRRYIEITLAFKELLSENEQINRNVSHYAESLHISPVYLNEVVKNVTGVSVMQVHSKRTHIACQTNVGIYLSDCAGDFHSSGDR